MDTHSLLHHRSSPLTEPDLDNACFLDWLATLAGYYRVPDRRGVFRVELDRGAVLRVTDAVGDEVIPLSVVELRETGVRSGGLTVARQHPATPLAELREQFGPHRLALEAELQRRRLYPLWIRWIEEQTREPYDVRDSDMYILRFLPQPRFADLVVIARHLPRIGPGMMWSLFRASSLHAALLFDEWLDAGEPERFRDLGGAFQQLAARCVGSGIQETMARVNSVMAHYGYVTQPVE